MHFADDIQISLADSCLPEHVDNPYPLYCSLQSKGSVYWDRKIARWIVTSYADVVTVLRDPRFSSNAFQMDILDLPEHAQVQLGETISIVSRMLLFLDPPDHTLLRGLVSKAFLPRTIETVRSQVELLANQALNNAMRRGHIDIIHEFAAPLSITVMAKMTGLQDEGREQLIEWLDDLNALVNNDSQPGAEIIRLLQSVSNLVQYLRDSLNHQPSSHEESALRTILPLNELVSKVSEDDLLSIIIQLLGAGYITTTHLIGNSFYALLQHPDQLQVMQQDAVNISSAVMELLRYDTPVLEAVRVAKEDIELAGQHIKAGQCIIAHLGAANHDAQWLQDADSLDVSRPKNQSAAFGYGIHFCLGAHLARLVTEVALSTLIKHLPNPVVEVAEREVSQSFRSFKTLSVRFG